MLDLEEKIILIEILIVRSIKADLHRTTKTVGYDIMLSRKWIEKS